MATGHGVGCRCLFFGLAIVIGGAGYVKGQEILIDNFDDGNDDGWTKLDTSIGLPWGPGTFDASSGSYHIVGSGPTDQREGSQLIAVYEASADPVYNNGFLRMTVRSNTPSTLPYFVMRGDTETFSGYAFGANPDTGNFFYNKVVNNVIEQVGAFSPSTPFATGVDWMLEAGTVGDWLTMRVWRLGDPEPPEPQWTLWDSTFNQGLFGIGANHWADQPPTTVDATFDDIVFTVPEPSTIALTTCGLLAIACRRPQRRVRKEHE